MAPTAFGYCESSYVYAEQGLQWPPSPANGDFSVALLSADPGIGAVGLFFVVAQLGLLHHPLALDHPEPFRCVSLNAFKDQVREKYGFGLGGVGVGAHDAAG